MSCPSILQCRDSNPQPLEHELSPITTRPALPPYFSIVYVRTYLCSSFHFKISLYYVVNLKKSTFQFTYPILELFDILVFEKIVNSLNLFLIIIRSQRCQLRLIFVDKGVGWHSVVIEPGQITMSQTNFRVAQLCYAEIKHGLVKRRYVTLNIKLKCNQCYLKLFMASAPGQVVRLMLNKWAVVVVKWSACLPSTPTIRVRIPLRSTIFCKIVNEKNKNKQKRGRGWPIKRKNKCRHCWTKTT